MTTRVCVECGAAVALLVRDYGKGNVRLAICGACNEVADKYVEYENVLLFLEVMLLKPQVYRHILYNLPAPMESRTILKMFAILVMLDMNVKAYLVDRKEGVVFRSESMYQDTDAISGFRISQFSLHLVLLALLENVVYFASVLGLIYADPFGRGWRRVLLEEDGAGDAGAQSSGGALGVRVDVLTKFAGTLCISSFGKMFALLTVIWEYHWTFIHMIGAVIFFSNVLGLQLFLADGDPAATRSVHVVVLVIAALGIRFVTQLLLYALGNSIVFYVKRNARNLCNCELFLDARRPVTKLRSTQKHTARRSNETRETRERAEHAKMSAVELPLVASARSTSSRGSLGSAGSSASDRSGRNQRGHSTVRAPSFADAESHDDGDGGIGSEEEDDEDGYGQEEEEPQESSGGLWDEVESFLNRPSPSLSALAKVNKKAVSGGTLPTLKPDLPRRRKGSEPESSSRADGRPTGRSLYQPPSKASSSKAIDPKLLQEAFAYAQKVSLMDFEDDQQEQADVIADRHHPLARSGSRNFTSASSSSFSSGSSSAGAAKDSSAGPRAPPSHGAVVKKQSTSSGAKSEDGKPRKKSTSAAKTHAYGSSAKPGKKKSERRVKEAAQWDPSSAPSGGGSDGASGDSANGGGGAAATRKHMDPQVMQSLVSNFQNGTTLDELRKELAASQQSMALSRQALQDAAKAFFRPAAH
ncbi:hypothetical protein PybrP1_004835 [[Pythium] brassicae (nom. inval.)]|nr:hypothetical protein PybrP1_004835 [[Pythium] brassicae (nom. inval.)]